MYENKKSFLKKKKEKKANFYVINGICSFINFTSNFLHKLSKNDSLLSRKVKLSIPFL